VNYASQAVSDGDGDRCPLRYYRKGTDIGADGEPLEILLGPTVTNLERCRRTRWGIWWREPSFVNAPIRRLGTEVRKRETQKSRNCKHTLYTAGVTET